MRFKHAAAPHLFKMNILSWRQVVGVSGRADGQSGKSPFWTFSRYRAPARRD
jgi:hypothetical protein